MLIGVCQIEMILLESDSLKAKRVVVKSVKTKLRNKFNISVAEVGNQELWQRVTLGFAYVTNEKRMIDQVFSKILEFLYNQDSLEVIDHQLDIY